MYPYTPYPYPPQPQVVYVPAPAPMPTTDKPVEGPLPKKQIKEIRKIVKFYNDILEGSEKTKKKKEEDNKNKTSKGGLFFLLMLLSPIIGPLYVVLVKYGINMMAVALQH